MLDVRLILADYAQTFDIWLAEALKELVFARNRESLKNMMNQGLHCFCAKLADTGCDNNSQRSSAFLQAFECCGLCGAGIGFQVNESLSSSAGEQSIEDGVPGLVLQSVEGCRVLVVLEEVFEVGETVFALRLGRRLDSS